MKNYKLNDYIAKLPYNHPYNRPELKEIKVIISNNNVVQNTKLLVPLINTSMSITGQYPKLIKTKKSVASFKLRKGGVVGLLTTLRGGKCKNFLNLLNVYGLPRIVSGPKVALTSSNSPFRGAKEGGNRIAHLFKPSYNSILTLGLNNITLFSYLTPLREESLQVSQNINLINPTKLTGGYTQLSQTFKPSKKLLSSPCHLGKKTGNIEELTHNLHKFFYSQLYVPLG